MELCGHLLRRGERCRHGTDHIERTERGPAGWSWSVIGAVLDRRQALARLVQRTFGGLPEGGCLVVRPSTSKISMSSTPHRALYDEAIALEAIGLAPPGKGLEMLARDRRCNPSGGSAAGYCAPAMGLARTVEAVLQLRRNAGGNQIDAARRALATGSSIIAAQTQTAVILEAA